MIFQEEGYLSFEKKDKKFKLKIRSLTNDEIDYFQKKSVEIEKQKISEDEKNFLRGKIFFEVVERLIIDWEGLEVEFSEQNKKEFLKSYGLAIVGKKEIKIENETVEKSIALCEAIFDFAKKLQDSLKLKQEEEEKN